VGQPGHRPLDSFSAVLLLVLVVSPVTAPFSSCDLENLLSDRDARHGALLQSTVVQDKPVDGLTGGFVLDVRHPTSPEPSIACTPAPAGGCALQQFPLRI